MLGDAHSKTSVWTMGTRQSCSITPPHDAPGPTGASAARKRCERVPCPPPARPVKPGEASGFGCVRPVPGATFWP